MEDNKNELEHTQINYELKGIITQMEAHNEVITAKLEQILYQTTKTNGRVDKLEGDFKNFQKSVDFVTVLSGRKWLLVILIAGIYFIFKNFDILQWAKKIL